MEEMKIKGLKIQAKPHTFKIIDSYKITDIEKILLILSEFLDRTEEYYTQRPLGSLLNEWVAHTTLYKLGLFKKSTQDSDFEAKINPVLDFIYKCIAAPALYKNKKQNKKRVKKILKAQTKWNKQIDIYLNNILKVYNNFLYCYGDTFLNSEQQKTLKTQIQDIIDNKIFNSIMYSCAERIIQSPIDQKEVQTIPEYTKIISVFLNEFKPYWSYWGDENRINTTDAIPYIYVCGIMIIAHALTINQSVEKTYNEFYKSKIIDIVTNEDKIRYLNEVIYEGVKYYD